MALVVADRVKETTTTTGTGTYTLAGAVDGFQSFSAIGNGNTCYYACTDGTDYEVGVGTFTLSGTTLARTTILESSNSDAAVNWGAGEKDIFVTLPASKAVFEDASNNVAVGNNITVGGTVDGVDIAARDGVLTSTTTTANAALPKAGGTMTGNIVMSGAQTVDGRDLSVDGAKLDNIEANADVTDAINVQAAGALMDSEVTDLDGIKSLTVPNNTTISTFGASLVDDADAAAARTTLGLGTAATTASTAYATAAQGTTADNALPKAGGQMTGNITMLGAQTVDGRDLSVDGAKLDGIEANATADQTAGEIEAIVNHDNLQGFVANEHIDWTASSAGTIHATNIPVVALTTVQTAANQTAHLALTAQEGDIVVRSDENKSYVHNGGTAGTMADYTELLTPTDAVLSVNGQTGAVTISNATTSSAGLMSSADKSKLDGVESGATADQTITAGAGLTGGGTGDVTISHADTSSQASVNGSGRTYIQDITLDTYGHVTGLATATETVTVPSGIIVMWSGAISAIPSGWVLCDGLNSTPDLRARFVIGAQADVGQTYDVGDTGGATSVTLATGNLPSHTHGAGSYAVDSHTHGTGNYAVGGHTHGVGTYAVGAHTHGVGTYAVGSHTHSDGTYAAAAHSHGAGNFAVGSHTHGAGNYAAASHTHTSGNFVTSNTGSHTHIPRFYNASNVGGNIDFERPLDNNGNGTVVNAPISTTSDGAHSHNISGNSGATAPAVSGNSTATTPSFSGNTSNASADVTGASGATTPTFSGDSASATPTFSGASASATPSFSGASGAATPSVNGTSGATGSGSAVSILNPYYALAYIMKT